MNEEKERPTIGTAEAAEIYHVTKGTISRWCRKRIFPNSYQHKEGSPWFIPVEDIELVKKKLGIQ